VRFGPTLRHIKRKKSLCMHKILSHQHTLNACRSPCATMRAGRKKKNEMRRQPGYIFWFIQMLNKGENIFLLWSCCACALYVCVLCNVTLCILLLAHAQAGDVLPYMCWMQISIGRCALLLSRSSFIQQPPTPLSSPTQGRNVFNSREINKNALSEQPLNYS
jgi:hypothetical protein